jgi:DNA uptake protein ComE-like DNA-binding protein
MKYPDFGPLKEWFGYSRKERRASYFLMIVVFIVAGTRYILPGRSIKIEEVPLQVAVDKQDTIAGRKTYQFRTPNVRSGKYSPRVTNLELNSADSASLEGLPGIGPVLAARIIKYRNLLGGYAKVDQLKEVYGLPEETYNFISGRLTADSSVVKKIRINSADYKQMIRLPYFSKQEVSAILKYRELGGRINSMDDLIDNKLIAKEKADKIRPYLVFD